MINLCPVGNMTEKCSMTQPVQRYQGLSSLTRSVRAVSKAALGARGFSNVDIIENWADILGPDLSRGIAPVKIVFKNESRSHGVLHVKSSGGAFAMLCEHQKGRILDRINTYFGYPAVESLKIIQGALKLKADEPIACFKKISKQQKVALEKKVALIEDEDLRRQMYEIGLALIQKNL